MTLIIPERQRTKKKEKPLAGVYCKGGKPASPVAAHADSWGKSQLPKRIPWGGLFVHLFQDTVVALHALSRYGAATFTRTGKAAQVTIQRSRTVSQNFQVDSSSRLLLQQIALPELPGEYSVTVTGEGCVYLQVRLWSDVGKSNFNLSY